MGVKIVGHIYQHHCLRCDKDFISRSNNPKFCGKCKSPYWNRPRRNDNDEKKPNANL
jgi:hypothetical protein